MRKPKAKQANKCASRRPSKQILMAFPKGSMCARSAVRTSSYLHGLHVFMVKKNKVRRPKAEQEKSVSIRVHPWF
jgi:ornithine carbamoyltransferase